MIFNIGVICKKLSRMHEFCEDPYSESCVLINGVNEVVSLFITFSGKNLDTDDFYTMPLENCVCVVQFGAVTAITFIGE